MNDRRKLEELAADAQRRLGDLERMTQGFADYADVEVVVSREELDEAIDGELPPVDNASIPTGAIRA